MVEVLTISVLKFINARLKKQINIFVINGLATHNSSASVNSHFASL